MLITCLRIALQIRVFEGVVVAAAVAAVATAVPLALALALALAFARAVVCLCWFEGIMTTCNTYYIVCYIYTSIFSIIRLSIVQGEPLV